MFDSTSDSSIRQTMNGCSFKQALRQNLRCLLFFILVLTVLGVFKIVLRLRDRLVSIWKSLEILNVFNALTLKQIFWITKTFSKKLENRFLVESTKIENPAFLYKTTLSEANVKVNRTGSTKCTDYKEQSFASNCFTFLKILFQIQRVDRKWAAAVFEKVYCKTWNSFCLNTEKHFLVVVLF